MAIEVSPVIVDAAPLIILAAAESLDYLLYPELPVVIPDAVFHEATAGASKLGALAILDWYRTHSEALRIEPTDVFDTERRLSEQPGYRPTRDLGERAAFAVMINDEKLSVVSIVVGHLQSRRFISPPPARPAVAPVS